MIGSMHTLARLLHLSPAAEQLEQLMRVTEFQRAPVKGL
jgi:hypothetical protein